MHAARLNFEIIVADDGSQDATLELIRLFEKRDPRVRALSCPHLGKGSAVRLGILNARGQFILFMDADGATPLTEISKLTSALEAGNDVAFGSRALHVSEVVKVKTSLHRRLIGRIFAFFVNVIAIGGVADTQCGFKMFRRETRRKRSFHYRRHPDLRSMLRSCFFARKLGFSIIEVPVNWVAQPGSKVDLVSDSMKDALGYYSNTVDASQLQSRHFSAPFRCKVLGLQHRLGVSYKVRSFR